jgi:hypothetical protein
MGKAAKNERLKITATYFNNIAVGLFVVGFAVPYLTLYPTEQKSIQMMIAAYGWPKVWGLLYAWGTALIASIGAHYAARRLLAKIED